MLYKDYWTLKTLRIYADTSVFGGCFDDEFSEESITFFKEIRKGKFILVLSTTTLRELEEAPDDVKKILAEIPVNHVELVEFSDEIKELRNAYLHAKILSETSKYDAEHIASASVADVDMIISWNFKHIVHYDKIIQYHSVNLLHGYKPIAIYSQNRLCKMLKNKKFDCVQMKWDIQQKILKEFADISEDKANKIQMERIIKNPLLGPLFLKKRGKKEQQL